MTLAIPPLAPATAKVIGQEAYQTLEMIRRLLASGAVSWDVIDFTNSDHGDIQVIPGANPALTDTSRVKHLSDADLKLVYDTSSTVTTLSGAVAGLSSSLTAHTSATSAHGASGNVIGTGDSASAGVRGPVFQAAAIADASVTVTGTAGVVYTTTEQGMINALKTDVEALRDKINALLSSLRTSEALGT